MPDRSGVVARVLHWLPDSWHLIDAQSLPRHHFGRHEAGLLVVVAAAMILQEFPAAGTHFADLVGPQSRWYELLDDVQWAGVTTLAYLVLPIVYLRVRGERLADFNLGFRGTARHLPVYVAMFVLMIVPLLLVAQTGDFQRIYPFYKGAGRSWLDFTIWQVAYAAQFVALEFFFRGFMLEGLRRTMGHGAIFVMVVPYVMLHFNKTAIESAAAAVAGILLGTMAMRWRSIWGAALLHYLVAITMDVTVLRQLGQFPPDRLTP